MGLRKWVKDQDFVQMAAFYLRVALRLPAALVSAAGVVGSLALLAAAALLVLSYKKRAIGVLSFQDIPRVWLYLACGLILAYWIARANYQEAKKFIGASNRVEPTPSSTVTIENLTVNMYGSNAVQPELTTPETRTEPESE